MGGAHSTAMPFEIINKETSVDICVRGEGEYVMRDLVKYYFIKKQKNIKDIPGLVYRENNKILTSGEPETIKQLDDLPFPAYELLDMENYLAKGYRLKPSSPYTTRVVEMITSRGCPYNCIFCSVQSIMGSRFRAHSSNYVLEHITYLINKYKVKYIRFNDDNIFLDHRRFESVILGVIERKLLFNWDCPNGIRADTLDRLASRI